MIKICLQSLLLLAYASSFLVSASDCNIQLSLYEAGWALRGEEWGGWFDCDSAIALDGGGSTQLYVEQHSKFTVLGDTPVHNAFVVKRK